MSETQPGLDAMTLRVLGGAFGAISKEMAQVIFRTAFFQIIREAEDLGAGLYTADGEEIAESETTAMHCGSIGAYLRGIRTVWGDDIAPGDVFLHNDPRFGASHLADVCVAIPIFDDGRLLASAADTAHLADLGSASAGLCTDAFDCFAEGRNYRALKIERAGQPNQELIRHIFENVCHAGHQSRGHRSAADGRRTRRAPLHGPAATLRHGCGDGRRSRLDGPL